MVKVFLVYYGLPPFLLFNLEYIILVRPKITPFTFGSDPFQFGQFVSIQCSVAEGDLPLTISWTFNGAPLTSSDDISVSKTGKRISTLTIEALSHELAGNYTCIGRNDAGIDSFSSQLLVNGSFFEILAF